MTGTGEPRENEAAARPPVDEDLLQGLIEALEGAIGETSAIVPPAKKAEALVYLYSQFAHAGVIDRSAVRRLIRLVEKPD